MEQNRKRFVVAAIAPVFILAGVLLYLWPFSSGADSGPAAEQTWGNNSSDIFTGGHGMDSFHGDNTAAAQNEQGTAGAYSHETWSRNSDETSMQGKGRGRNLSSDNSDSITRRGRGKSFTPSDDNSGGDSSRYENQELSPQQRGNGRGRINQSVPQNFS